MRNVLPICTGLVVILGVVSATMWLELRNERQVSDGLRTQLTDANARIQKLTLTAQGATGRPGQVVPAAPETRMESAAVAKVPQPAVTGALVRQNREQELMADPEYRKAVIARQRMGVERNNPGLVEELGLSPKEADALFDMLVDQQMKMSSELNGLVSSVVPGNGGRPDDATRAEITRKREAVKKQQDEELAALLGAGRYAQWQEYNETKDGRVQAMELGAQLAQAGQPLNSVQQRSLGKVLAVEQKRLHQQVDPLVRSVNQSDPQARLQLQEDALKWEEESNRRILDAAAAHLTARQIESLRQQYESEAAMRVVQLRADKRRLEIQGSRPAP